MTASIGSGAGAPLNITGLESGLNTGEIISALLAVERAPITRLSNQETTLEGQREQLQSFQSSLGKLTFAAQELGSPTLFNDTQTVSSSDTSKVTATSSSGAAIGGYELEVTQLANSAQRTFTFKSPASAETLTIDGQEISVAAGASIQSLANTINSDSKATVYAAAVNGETLVLSTRATGATGASFIQVSAPGGTLVEQAGLAKEGRDAEYSVDGITASSTTNTVTNAVPGVTLNLLALTSATGPVTIDVQPPTPSASAITSQVQSFVSLYNSTIGAIEKQLSTKPPTSPQSVSELKTGTLFGDFDLTNVLNGMRESIYEPVAGQPAEMSSLASIGVSTGAPSGTATYSQSSVEGQLQINTAQLEAAVKANPAGVQQMLQGWAKSFEAAVNTVAGPGGALELRVNGDNTQTSQMASRITTMNELLAVRQKSLEEQYEAMEKAIAKSKAEGEYLSQQLAQLNSSSSSSSSSG
ncbi:MAG TPA: flagellar filament capping protein FliD [Solirubrobacteraceae bacterium]|jgi:flagellar hook-associated protein 2|nr:flagellar filament capping protein FliD [Solirubrobacteraceae bacterium]